MPALELHPDRLFPTGDARAVARRLFEHVEPLPLLCPHGHTDARWFADDERFANPTELLIRPDHYLLRMLYSQGVALEDLGVRSQCAEERPTPCPRTIWRCFARHYHLFRGTPSRTWLDHTFRTCFDVKRRLDADSADEIYDQIEDCLGRDEYRPRALFERFRIEALATTESPLDSLEAHAALRASDWCGRVITTYRPDPVVDAEYEGFGENVQQLGTLTGEDTSTWQGYLGAHRVRRAFFREHGATATDHGHPTARTADLPESECAKLFDAARRGAIAPKEAELFRAQMLTEMARMSLDDGLVMQIHPGSVRNHNPLVFERFGRDMGADIPSRGEYVHALRPLLELFGNDPRLSVILFTLDESTYTRELAPLAGHYPSLKLGPPWWFLDSPEAMLRFRRAVTETAGFYNTVGFNDDTRAFPSIPARHDVARRMDCAYLAELVVTHRLDEDEAVELAVEAAYGLAKRAYRL